MFYTDKMFWTKSQVSKICYNVVISENKYSKQILGEKNLNA